MTLLVDTHLLLWAATDPDRLSAQARRWIEDERSTLLFSAASIWEVAVKHKLHRHKMPMPPGVLRGTLVNNGYDELPIKSEHAIQTVNLPLLHKDPFDRILVAQAVAEGVLLLTSDRALGEYGGPVVTV